MKLNILDNEELWQLISKLIDEIRLDHYAGGHPPQKSYEPLISECELWAFTWSSFVLRKQMYLKFALKEGTFYYVSLHESKFVSKINERKNDEMFEMR